MYNVIRGLYRITLKPVYKGLLILRSWIIICCRFLVLTIIKSQKTDRYKIRTSYVARRKNIHFDDTSNKDEFQDGVYKRIQEFIIEKHLNSIIDVGCGSGFKLVKYFGDFQTIGMELFPALDHLKKKYPEKNWIYSDFKFIPGEPYDIAISIDVIEHLIEPDQLLNYLKTLKPKFVVISTPDRDKLPYQSRLGPPMNSAHIREWNKEEFVKYFSINFDIIESRVIDYQDHYIIGTPKV